ncbi:hypothetical protein B296_00036527 [Ensete ventricosum]|uniref:Uncharacterized protein n=1 Tax=Ensete ventricosum TaxID=4639 RepID=A0A426Z903_ENSVE|nr:hypothetical protein B296_00036527 [Ensete ventricosum]
MTAGSTHKLIPNAKVNYMITATLAASLTRMKDENWASDLLTVMELGPIKAVIELSRDWMAKIEIKRIATAENMGERKKNADQ